MRHKKMGLGLALLVLLLSAVLGATVLREPIAYAASPFQNVIVENTDANPVPVRATEPVSVQATEPVPVNASLWQGTPYVGAALRITLSSFGCATLSPAVPEGKTLYATRAITNFNVAPGRSGSAILEFTPLGGSVDFIDLPTHPGAPARQVVGLYDKYEGAVDIGLPTATTPEACFVASSGSDLSGKITVLGYLLDTN
jgi:hypothetical protein